jgi:thiamine biosynthesis lipoprotein
MLYRIDFRAMGCRMIAMVDSSSPAAPKLLAQVPNWFDEWEQTLSRFRVDSELNLLNRQAGWPVKVSHTLWDVFQAAVDAEKASDGLVMATVLEAMVNAGYDRSFDQLLRERLSGPANNWNMVTSLSEVSLDQSARTICLPADVRLDFGGVAKGWAAAQAAQRLSDHGSALVSAGGDMAISGELPNAGLWPVTIDDPFKSNTIITTLQLGSGGVATSGTDYRRWKQGGQWSHHIIDPRTGQPAQTDLITATVIAPSAMQAEMAAKTALILGSQHGLDWIEARPELSALLVLETGDILYSNHFEQYFWRS